MAQQSGSFTEESIQRCLFPFMRKPHEVAPVYIDPVTRFTYCRMTAGTRADTNRTCPIARLARRHSFRSPYPEPQTVPQFHVHQPDGIHIAFSPRTHEYAF
jgi:hypothetical protein